MVFYNSYKSSSGDFYFKKSFFYDGWFHKESEGSTAGLWVWVYIFFLGANATLTMADLSIKVLFKTIAKQS